MKIAIFYILFSAVATIINLATQYAFFNYLSGWWVMYLALFFGTLSGLIVKYILDKKWIFNYQHVSNKDNTEKFILYSLMGVVTTLVFWGMEMVFYYFFSFNGAQYVGGALGLAIGYVVKYHLDKKYVFKVNV